METSVVVLFCAAPGKHFDVSDPTKICLKRTKVYLRVEEDIKVFISSKL
jgi:hypothetical protein